jgi:PKD repeat protein
MLFSSHKVKWVTVFVCLAAAAVLLTCGEKGTGPNSPTPAIPVEAKFGTSSATGAPPLTVQFTDSSAGSPDFWFWRFGDGESSFDQHPSHEYDQEGDYDVSLVVSRGEVKDSILRVGLISVDDSATALAPSAGFIADPLTGRAPLLVQFTNQSSGTISSYAWDFGDGGSSTAASVAHLYTAEGRYTVRLIVSGAGGADTIRMVNYITVTVAAPNAAFTAAPTSGQPPLSVTFTNQSTGSITGYKWYFGDGDSSTVQNPVHMYDAAGLYSVTLIAVGPGGADTNRVANYIAVSTGRPIAAFTGAPTQGTTPLTVQFTNNSAGNITSYLWSFGDSSSSTLEDPNHLYTFAGQYTIRLIATGPGGSDTTSRVNYITVRSAPPVVHFSGTPTTGLVPLDVNFNNTTTGEVTGYNWSFGDGVTSTLANPSHRYNTGGLYTVRLIATGPGGVDTLIRSYYITATWPRPTAAFTGAPTTGVVPFNVNFTNNSTGQISSYLWSFGDGGTSTSASPAHDYTVPGIYSVRLIATGPGGADTLTRSNYVTAQYPRPTAGFTGQPTQGTVPFAVNFTSSSIGEITSYAWTFGDGGTSNEANPSHS